MKTYLHSRNRWFALVTFLGMFLAVISTLLSALDAGSLPVGVASTVACSGLIYLVVRAARAGVVLEGKHLTYKGYLLSHRLARQEVDIIRSKQIDSKIIYEVHAPVLTTIDGQEYVFASLAGACLEGRSPRSVQSRMDVLGQWIDAAPQSGPSETR